MCELGMRVFAGSFSSSTYVSSRRSAYTPTHVWPALPIIPETLAAQAAKAVWYTE
jgi:hypothetical protein